MTLEVIRKNSKVQFFQNIKDFYVPSTIGDIYIVVFENNRQAFFNRSEVVCIGWKEDLCP